MEHDALEGTAPADAPLGGRPAAGGAPASGAQRARRRSPLARQRLVGADFARVYKHGRRAQGAFLTVVVLENALARTRLGLSVSKRHARHAVDRNRVRRIFREAFRLEHAALPQGLDVVMIATRGGPAPGLEEARAELLALVARALRKKPRGPAQRESGLQPEAR